MKRRLFNIVTVVSLAGFLAFAALWARSLGHFEMVDCRYASWPQRDELHRVYASFSWYSNTLCLEVIQESFLPSYFRNSSGDTIAGLFPSSPPGMQFGFVGRDTTLAMNGFPPGFTARHSPYGTTGVVGDRWVLAVRPWLPTLVTLILPAIVIYRYRRAARLSASWQFGLRGMFVVMTALCVFLWLVIRLKN